jgi:hypothetical protein
MSKFHVKIVLTEGEPIDTVIEGESEERLRSYFRSTSDFRQRNGDPYIINLSIEEVHEEIQY